MPKLPRMGFFGAGNQAALWKFWGETEDTNDRPGGYFKELIAPPKRKRSKREMTEAITLLFERRSTIVVVKMEDGTERRFTCGVFEPKKAPDVAKEFAMIMDGRHHDDRVRALRKKLQGARCTDRLVITRHDVELVKGDGDDENTDVTADEVTPPKSLEKRRWKR